MPTHDDDGKTDAEKYIDSLDRDLQPGDVAYDKNDGSWVYVVGIEAPTVRSYDERNGGRDLLTYAGNQLTDCTLDDRVIAAVHLTKNTTKSAGKGHGDSGVYDYPEGRLVRFVPETADDDLRRIQDILRTDMLSELLQTAAVMEQGTADVVRGVIRKAYGPEMKHQAQGLAQVEIGDQWGAYTGITEPDDDEDDADAPDQH